MSSQTRAVLAALTLVNGLINEHAEICQVPGSGGTGGGDPACTDPGQTARSTDATTNHSMRAN